MNSNDPNGREGQSSASTLTSEERFERTFKDTQAALRPFLERGSAAMHSLSALVLGEIPMDTFTALELRKFALDRAITLTVGRPDACDAQSVVKDASAFLDFLLTPQDGKCPPLAFAPASVGHTESRSDGPEPVQGE